MLVILKRNVEEISLQAAQLVASAVRKKPALTLGLATGSTMVSVYKQLVALHQRGSLDFSRVVTFNLDEYLGLPSAHPQSFHHFMHEMMEALRMRGGKSEIFIEIKSNDAGEIERAVLVKSDELFVNADHGAASGQAKRQGRFFAHRTGNELSGLKADFFNVAFQDHQHAASSLNRALSVAANNYEPAKEIRQP